MMKNDEVYTGRVIKASADLPRLTSRKKHPLYETWKSMRKRCNQRNARAYQRYGAVGISICPEWDDFLKFVEDMGPKPTAQHTVDRIDGKLGYSKSNCRWASREEQNENRRIKYECFRGHPWTEQSTMWTHNGIKETRRCRICYEKRAPKKNRGVAP